MNDILKKAVLIVVAILLCSLTGCNKNQTGNSVSDSVSGALGNAAVEESKDSQGLEADSDNTDSSDAQNEQSSDLAEFDFDDALKNITLFGSKISLPCTITDFGEDFSLSEGYVAVFDDIASCSILYHGKSIGTVSMIDYNDGDDLNNKQIVSMMLGFIATDIGASASLKETLYESRGWYYGTIEVDFAGLSFESTEAEVESIFGEPSNKDDDSTDYTFHSDDQSKSVEIEFYQGKVKLITINI